MYCSKFIAIESLPSLFVYIVASIIRQPRNGGHARHAMYDRVIPNVSARTRYSRGRFTIGWHIENHPRRTDNHRSPQLQGAFLGSLYF